MQQNSTMLQQKLAEKQKLMGQLDQAKMQEQLNAAMSSLSETVGQDVPTFNEVRDKIEARYAKAKGMTELNETSVESRMLEIQQATENAQATARLDQIRAQLGIAPAPESPAAGAEPRPTPRHRQRAPATPEAETDGSSPARAPDGRYPAGPGRRAQRRTRTNSSRWMTSAGPTLAG